MLRWAPATFGKFARILPDELGREASTKPLALTSSWDVEKSGRRSYERHVEKSIRMRPVSMWPGLIYLQSLNRFAILFPESLYSSFFRALKGVFIPWVSRHIVPATSVEFVRTGSGRVWKLSGVEKCSVGGARRVADV